MAPAARPFVGIAWGETTERGTSSCARSGRCSSSPLAAAAGRAGQGRYRQGRQRADSPEAAMLYGAARARPCCTELPWGATLLSSRRRCGAGRFEQRRGRGAGRGGGGRAAAGSRPEQQLGASGRARIPTKGKGEKEPRRESRGKRPVTRAEGTADKRREETVGPAVASPPRARGLERRRGRGRGALGSGPSGAGDGAEGPGASRGAGDAAEGEVHFVIWRLFWTVPSACQGGEGENTGDALYFIGKALLSAMDKIYTEPNVESDNTEHIRGKRLSSILKAPRNPLEDLGNGQELTQDINGEKRRKTSRRVSFANTINCRVFQRDLKNNTAESESTECAADTRNDDQLNQDEEPEAVLCEITGMNTLLHAPIQALAQQAEWCDADNAAQRTARHDTTFIFSEENEMEMTASHTAVIARNLRNNAADTSGKIDVTAFLAGLNSNGCGAAETSQDHTNRSCPSSGQNEDATPVKKIDFNEFLMSLKSNRETLSPAEGPEKENVFFGSSRASEDVAASSELAYSHEPLDACNVTKVFREQEAGMEMTKCQASAVQAVFAGAGEALPEQSPPADVTEAFVDDGMDMTTSHTAKMSFPISSVGNQSLNLKKDFPSTETDNSALKRASNQHLMVQQDPQLGTDRKAVSVEDRRDAAVLRAVKQEARTMAAIPGSISSETVFRGDKTVVFSKCDDMEITGNYTDVIYNDSAKSSSHHQSYEKPVSTNASLAETRRPARADGDTTMSLASLDTRGAVSYRNSALELPSGSDERKVTQDRGTASVTVGFESCTNSVSAGISTSRLQHSLANSQLASLPGEKTVVFSGEDMDLTKTCVIKGDGKSVANDSHAGTFAPVACKPHFLGNTSLSPNLNEQEEMDITRCHAVVIDDQSNGTAVHCNITPGKEPNRNVSGGTCSWDMDKENLIDGNIKRSQAIAMNTKDLEVMVADKKLGKTTFQAGDPSSRAKSLRPLRDLKREGPENIVTSAGAFVSLQSQTVGTAQPVGKTLLKATVPCTKGKTGMFADDGNMDITKTHPAAFDVAPAPTGREYENNQDANSLTAKQLQSQTFLFPGSSGVGITSQTAGGDLNTVKQTVTTLAPSGSFISSNEPAPSGMKGKERLGSVLGISAGCQDSDRQEETHILRAVPTRVDSKRDRTSQPPTGTSQLPSLGEKSVVFPSGENMDLTGSCAGMVPGYSTNAGSAAPGSLVQDENQTVSLTKGLVRTVNSREPPACGVYSLPAAQNVVTRSGLKPLPSADEQTRVFSAGADMDITRSHTVSADKILVQHGSWGDDAASMRGDRTCVFTYSDYMEISHLDAVAVDKATEKAAPQGMFNIAKRTGRKSLKGTTGEKTVLFSLSDENDDMEMTQSHTAAIGHEIASQAEGGLRCLSSAHPVKAVTFTRSQAHLDMTKSCSADRSTVEVVRGSEPKVGEEVGQQALSSGRTAPFALDGVEIAKPHQVALGGNPLQGQQHEQSVPFTATVQFPGYQADMDMTQVHPADESTERVLGEDRLSLAKQVAQEAVLGSKTVVFAVAEDMEMTKTHTAIASCAAGVQDREAVPGGSAVPADKTIVFTHNQEDMEITASHTTAVNNNIDGLGDREVSHQSTQQPGLPSASFSCRGERDSSHTKDPNGDYHTSPEGKPSVPSSASSASAFPGEKGAIKVPSGTTPEVVHSVSLPEGTVDVQTPQDLHLPTGNPGSVSNGEDLVPPENLTSKRVSFKLPSDVPMDCSEEGGDLASRVSPPIPQPRSSRGSPDARDTQRNQLLHGDASSREDLATDLGLAGASLVPASNEETKENKGLAPPKAFQINSDQTKQPLVGDSPRDETGARPAPGLSGISSVCSKLKDIRRRSAALSVSETALPLSSDQLPLSSVQPERSSRLGKAVNEPSQILPANLQENTCPESGAAPTGADLGKALKDKYQGLNVPLGIFQPKLPNRRNASVSSVQDINAKSSSKGEAAASEADGNAGEASGNSKSSRQNFSPCQFIAEEFLPVCLEEMDSNGSVSSELMDNACSEFSKKQTSCNENNQFEETKPCNSTKRALEPNEEDLQSPKKVKRDENLDGEASQDFQVTFGAVSQSHAEVHEGEGLPNPPAKSPDCTHASTSSSLDSVKADTELTIQRSSQMESQLLTDSICEDNLREKFQSGAITVGEFFTLLQVHVAIQKPRHSHLPATVAVSAAPTPEDLLYSQYVYRPKLRIYEEDCQALSQMIDELKVYAAVQDQLLVNVNKSLWEVMRTCSDEELRSFGAELNKMKSYFTKESKILAHNEKATLYSRLLQSAQEQQGKLQSRIEKVNELVKEAESCLVALKGGSYLEEWEADSSDEMARGRSLVEELESLKAQEEELQKELSELETQNEQMLLQMHQLEEKEKSCQEVLESFDFTEWEIAEWSEQQAVFHFLYDSIELTVGFEPPTDGDVFGEDPSRKVVSLKFESLLDEDKAPPSSCLVRRLIFQFIESQGCWQEKCPTLSSLPQVLHEVSLVVGRCKILGEEIEFLERWGGKFNLLKTDIKDTKVKLLFSASAAFAKFELTLSLSASYPSASLPFTVQSHIGNVGEEEVSAVLSSVPFGSHYLRRTVSSIHQRLLQHPR
ncbi:kinetochore scaffold 1 [Colius striatus]|uniref:kinetochore scaffold 1 n=1 Tax=Colius striatus TaxID=57412 RepID=UPI002B1E5DDE|nr:kinetochore scaffold 1 [Colius striatus]